nr:putative ribonuclease H-like domain-containing protein [Tanacetum cinerariifolium]
KTSSTNNVNTASTPVNTASTPANTASTPVNIVSLLRNVSAAGPSHPDLSTDANQDNSQILSLKDIYKVPNDRIFISASYDDEGVVADFTNMESTVNVSPIPQSRIHSIHPTTQILRDRNSVVQTRSKVNKRLKPSRSFLAFASYMRFIVYQMDVKSAFLYGKINEEVYVSQPPGFIDPKFPKKVYKVVKAFYDLHQAPRAWYATLSTFLGKSGYIRGLIDNTLFIKKDKNDIMLVQVYVDDIIFGFTKKSWCDEFEALMKNRFQMSSIEAADVDVHLYRSMIGSLMYLTASIPDIIESAFDLEAYLDSDYAGANLDRKSITGEDERKYTLIKEIIERMMALRLIAKSKSEAALDLFRIR